MTREELLAVARNCADGGPCGECPFSDDEDCSADCITNVMKELIALVERGEVSAGR